MNVQAFPGMPPEQTLFTCPRFGAVTSTRVIYHRWKGFSGGSRVDIPLMQVTSVRLGTTRSWPLIIAMLVVAIGCLSAPGIVRDMGAAALVLDFILFLGSPTVVVNTTGQDLKKQVGHVWELREATAFVKAIRAQLVSR